MSKTPLIAPADGEAVPVTAASNPFEALLPEDRLRKLQALPVEQQQAFYGRVVHSVFSDPAYQNLMFAAAQREFDRIWS